MISRDVAHGIAQSEGERVAAGVVLAGVSRYTALATQVRQACGMADGWQCADRVSYAKCAPVVTRWPGVAVDEPRLLAGASRAELDPEQDACDHEQQPGREQDVRGEAEDGQGHDGDEDNGDDRKHGDRSPFVSQWWFSCPRLPPPVARVDRDQP